MKSKNKQPLLYFKVTAKTDNIIYTDLRLLVQTALWFLCCMGLEGQRLVSENIPKWMLLQTSMVLQFVILKERVVVKTQDTQNRGILFGMWVTKPIGMKL